jgi:GT2 family glycosyltransferase
MVNRCSEKPDRRGKGTDISVIIANWNTKDLLAQCLNSLYETAQGLTFEIIVVDNASTDGSVAMLRREFPSAVVVENSVNRGFGAASNQGFRVMKGRYALLLNTDTILVANAVQELFSFLESHPDAAMACGQLLNADGSKQNSIAAFPSFLTLMTNMSLLEYLFPKRFPSKRYSHAGPVEIESGIGACLLVRKRAMDEVGLLDERYFFFFEETDWAYQMRSAGWKIFHVPAALIYHFQGQSIGRDIRSRIEFYRSRYQFFRKWKSRPYFVAVSAVIIMRLFVNWLFTSGANVFTLFMQKEMRSRWLAYSQLLLWHFHGCPGRILVNEQRSLDRPKGGS